MNKIVFGVLLFASAFACLCIPQIEAAYKKVEKHIEKYVGGQTKELEKVIKNTQEITAELEHQNQLLEKYIAVEKANTLEQKKILFHLKKKNHLID